jgi:multidrug resistance efflux pump
MFDLKKNKKIVIILSILIAAAITGGLVYLFIASKRVYVENGAIQAPETNITPQVGGVLQEVYVREGDVVGNDAPLARVGNELLKSNMAGLVIAVNDKMGTSYGRGQTVVTMIDPGELRAVGRVEEDKGLKDIKVGESAIFTVDAFGKKQYAGIVDEISPTSREGDIVFNISGKRETKEFDVKVRFNIAAYPELKNGMSAKIWIYK